MQRINCILKNPEYLKYLKKNIDAEAGRIYCRHNTEHFLDVARIAYILSMENHLDMEKEVIYAAGLLHDIGRWAEYEDGTDHAAASKELAEVILPDCGFSVAETDEICEAIGSHRNGPGRDVSDKGSRLTLSDILYKADKLSRNCVLCEAKSTCKNFQHEEEASFLY